MKAFDRHPMHGVETRAERGTLKQNLSVPALPPQSFSTKFKLEKSSHKGDHTEKYSREKNTHSSREMLDKSQRSDHHSDV